jgi:hypothetical protein
MKTYQILALVAVILGFLFGIGLMGLGLIVNAGPGLGMATIIFSIVGFIMAMNEWANPKLFGIVLMMVGLLLFFSSLLGLLPGILLIISGFLMRKEESIGKSGTKDLILAIIIVLFSLLLFAMAIEAAGRTTNTDKQSEIKYINIKMAHLGNFDSYAGDDGIVIYFDAYEDEKNRVAPSGQLDAVLNVECRAYTGNKTEYRVTFSPSSVSASDYNRNPAGIKKQFEFADKPELPEGGLCTGEVTLTLTQGQDTYSDSFTMMSVSGLRG